MCGISRNRAKVPTKCAKQNSFMRTLWGPPPSGTKWKHAILQPTDLTRRLEYALCVWAERDDDDDEGDWWWLTATVDCPQGVDLVGSGELSSAFLLQRWRLRWRLCRAALRQKSWGRRRNGVRVALYRTFHTKWLRFPIFCGICDTVQGLYHGPTLRSNSKHSLTVY